MFQGASTERRGNGKRLRPVLASLIFWPHRTTCNEVAELPTVQEYHSGKPLRGTAQTCLNSPSLPETVVKARGESNQRLEIGSVLSSSQHVLQLLTQPQEVDLPERCLSNRCSRPECGTGWSNLPKSPPLVVKKAILPLAEHPEPSAQTHACCPSGQ